MDYNQTLKYLESLQPKAFRLELGPITEACHIMGDPHIGLPVVHISGTNGKGSTAAFLASILEHSGYHTGLFTSPHLVDVRERIQVDRTMISQKELARISSLIRDMIGDDSMLTYFEFLTLVSFVFFKGKKVDIAVYETGLGGRLDATNIVEPLVTVITPISIDHTRHLGTTVGEIAAEKCGIIKRGVPTVVAYQPPEAMDVIRRNCDEMGSPLCLATPDEITTPLGLAGEHQRQNAACAVEAAELLEQADFPVKGIEEALSTTRWPGRLEMVQESPRVILDGAHNVAGAESLALYIRSTVPREKAVLLLGVLADKDVAGIVRPLAPLFREVVCTNAPLHRAASPKDLAALARSSGAEVSIEEDVKTALKAILKRLSPDDTLIVSGSLTVVGEAQSYFYLK